MALSLCGSIGANTGELQCDAARGVIRKLYIFGGAITAANYADSTALGAALKAASLLPKTDKDKLFPLPEVQNIEDRSEANTTGSLNQGFTSIIREGKPAYELKIFAGNELVKNLRKFNNATVQILELDSNGKLWGTASGTSVVGYKAKLFFGGLKSATGQNVEEGVVTFTVSVLDNSEYYDNAKYLDVSGVNLNNVKSLVDAELFEAAAKASNVYKIGARVATSKAGSYINLHDEYPTELANASRWEAFTGATFTTSLAITTVAVDNTNKCWTVTFDNTAFTALSANAKIKVQLKDPATLDAADIVDIESIPVVVTK
jgi:hypothetical protein